MIASGIDINKAAALLAHGDLVAIPTETVYGLAANALNENAVHKIFAAKNRPLHNPLIMHLANKEQIHQFVLAIPDIFEQLIEKFSPGPLTFLLPKNNKVSGTITNGSPYVAIRIPNHTLTLELLNQLNLPIVAPSANKFGSISPTQVEHVQKQFTNEVAYILDGGNCATGIESTVIGFENDTIVIYRHGAITQEMLEQIYPSVITKIDNNINPIAPGMLTQHYSPNTHLIVFDSFEEMGQAVYTSKTGYISFDSALTDRNTDNQIILSVESSLNKAAHQLYAALYEMDTKNLDAIYTHLLPHTGIGIAINDKLKRAAAKF